MDVDFEKLAQHNKHLARTLAAERKRLGLRAPAFALQNVGTDSQVETPEEREAFERIEQEQTINAIAAIVRECKTTSATGIAARLYKAGYGLIKSVK